MWGNDEDCGWSDDGETCHCDVPITLVAPLPVQVFDFFITFNAFVLDPVGSGTADSTTVTVFTTPPVSNQAVILSLGEIVGSGGHIAHAGGRPLGTLAATQGSTGGDGTFKTTYTSPAFGRQIGIFAQVTGYEFTKGEPMKLEFPTYLFWAPEPTIGPVEQLRSFNLPKRAKYIRKRLAHFQQLGWIVAELVPWYEQNVVGTNLQPVIKRATGDFTAGKITSELLALIESLT